MNSIMVKEKPMRKVTITKKPSPTQLNKMAENLAKKFNGAVCVEMSAWVFDKGKLAITQFMLYVAPYGHFMFEFNTHYTRDWVEFQRAYFHVMEGGKFCFQ
jgi:hypothetical protein